jgi:hypothetical protein
MAAAGVSRGQTNGLSNFGQKRAPTILSNEMKMAPDAGPYFWEEIEAGTAGA